MLIIHVRTLTYTHTYDYKSEDSVQTNRQYDAARKLCTSASSESENQ